MADRDQGRASPSGRATLATPQAPAGLGDTATIPSAEQFCGGPGEHLLCGCITSHVRAIMRHWTGTNCTWADDDVTALGILANKAIRAGLHYGDELPDSLIECIDAHVAEAGTAETVGLGPEDESAVGGNADVPETHRDTPIHSTNHGEGR